MKQSASNLVKFLIGWPLSFVALYFIYKSFAPQSETIVQQLQHISWLSLLFAVFCFLLYYILRSIVWQRLLKLLHHSIPYPESTFLWASSEIKRYIPGNIWSFLGRTLLFGQRGVKKTEVAKLLAVELALILLGVFVVSLLGLLFLKSHVFAQIPFDASMTKYVFAAVSVLLGIYVFHTPLRKRIGVLAKIVDPFFIDTTAKENIILLTLSISSFFFFGLGYFFAVVSIVPLDPARILAFVGFFAFALIVGLFSFITPTGLGVREGVIAIGLTPLIGASLAGFVSLFSRLILVLSEVLFIACIFCWYRFEKGILKRIISLITKHQHVSIVTLLILLFSVYFSVVSIARFDQYYTGRFDLGNMAQTVWNTKHGNFFSLSHPFTGVQVSRLAIHSDFLLVFLVPFYYLWEDPRILLIVQAVVTGLGGYFVYLIANNILKQKTLAILLVFMFLMNPSVQRVTLYDFHAVALATTFLLGAVYFMLKKKPVWFLVFAFLAALTKEQVWFVLGLLGIAYAVINKEKLFGTSVFLTGILLFYLIIWQIMPKAAGTQHFALSYFSEDLESPSQLIKNVFLQPAQTLQTLFEKGRIDYLVKLFAPLGFLPFLAPLWLIFAGPDLTINLLSQRSELQQIYYQYTAVITPFLFVAVIFALRFIKKRLSDIPDTVIALYLLAMTFAGAYYFGALPGSREANLDMFRKPLVNKNEVDSSLALIPTSASVAASNELGSHLSHRKVIYSIPLGITTADYVVFLLRNRDTLPPRTDQELMILQLRQNANYELISSPDTRNFFLFKRRSLLVNN